jgi:hypothetical protein
MGNLWGAGKENGEGRGRGRSVYKQPGTRVDRDRTTHKGGIPSKQEGFGNRGGIFQAEGDYQGGLSRGYQGDCAMCLQYNVNLVHIVLIVCMSCHANKRIVFRL